MYTLTLSWLCISIIRFHIFKRMHSHEYMSQKLPSFARWLEKDDPLRLDRPDGRPKLRRHMQACAHARANEEWDGAKTKPPSKDSGVARFCPLCALDRFDIIWDIMLDMMHTIKNFWEARVMPTFSGDRVPASKVPPKPVNKTTNENDADYCEKFAAWCKAGDDYAKVVADHALCTFPIADRIIVDKRVQELAGEPGWINSSLVLSCCSPVYLNSIHSHCSMLAGALQHYRPPPQAQSRGLAEHATNLCVLRLLQDSARTSQRIVLRHGRGLK